MRKLDVFRFPRKFVRAQGPEHGVLSILPVVPGAAGHVGYVGGVRSQDFDRLPIHFRTSAIAAQQNIAAHFARHQFENPTAARTGYAVIGVERAHGSPLSVVDRQFRLTQVDVAIRVGARPHVLDVMIEEVSANGLRRRSVLRLFAHAQREKQPAHGVRRFAGLAAVRAEQRVVQFVNHRGADFALFIRRGAGVSQGVVGFRVQQRLRQSVGRVGARRAAVTHRRRQFGHCVGGLLAVRIRRTHIRQRVGLNRERELLEIRAEGAHKAARAGVGRFLVLRDNAEVVAPEELAQELPRIIVVVHAGGRGEEGELLGFQRQPQPVQKQTQDVRHFRSRRSAIRVELVHHQKELVGGVGFQPVARLVEHARLDAPHQHDVQHVVVGYENVGRRILHIPARPHFAAVHVLEVVARIRRQAVVISDRVALVRYSAHVVAKSPEAASRAGSARRRRLPGVAPESHAVARSVGVHPRERIVRIERLAQAAELVFD